jgi:hypothetical protein
MSGTTISNNSAGTAGGIYLNGGSHVIQNSTIAYNTTTDSVGLNTSSAIRVAFAELLLDFCIDITNLKNNINKRTFLGTGQPLPSPARTMLAGSMSNHFC